ncbi:GNAT family N-acetyltransferase, partial [Streptomyces sp. SID6137]|nr:GNAT family N-acetyltransferase [Streptomyces sp. SID6137]
MGRRLVPLTLDNLQDLPQRCRSCVFWELDPVSGEAAV